MKQAMVMKVVLHISRKRWWHVPPVDERSYARRGKFLASSYAEAQFWGRPLDEPQRVTVSAPLIGDEGAIETKLFGRRKSCEGMSLEARWRLDARMKRRALSSGYDSILLMGTDAYSGFRSTGKIPRSLELNVLRAGRG